MGIIAKSNTFVNRFQKINSYQTISLVLDILEDVSYNNENQNSLKCNEGKSTPFRHLTESLRMLKEDRQLAGEHGSRAAWLSEY